MNQRIGYARVSTDDQNLDLQRDALKQTGCALIYEEAASGKNAERPELEQCRKALRAGDKRLLDLVRTCCKGQDKPILDACQRFNQETADGRRMQPYSDLLGKAIRSMIEVKEEKDLDSLFTGGKTTALTGTISGLDDFELISFLVIQEAE